MQTESSSANHLSAGRQAWLPAPAGLALAPGDVHVFRMDLNLSPDRIEPLARLLTTDELARAARFHFAEDQRRFTAARGQMRSILARFLPTSPEHLRFHYNPDGKPSLENAGWLQFNLSHSADLALLAVTAGQEVGVDLERTDRSIDFHNVARRFFAPAEVETLFALPEDQQPAAFFACWTRKEAYMKARGLGLRIPLRQFVVSLAPDVPPRLLQAEPGAPPGPYHVETIDPGPGMAGALVLIGTFARLHRWDWPGTQTPPAGAVG